MSRPRKNKHWWGRPPRGRSRITDLERLNGRNKWVPDDGKPGRAFVGKRDGFPMAWGPGCDCLTGDNCPQEKAMNRCCDRWRCANGSVMRRSKKT